MYLFDLASRHMTWLSQRQAITAGNIANSDTPGYRAQGIADFSAHLAGPSIELATTSSLHMAPPASETVAAEQGAGDSWGSSHSGNNVSVERELMTASSSSRMMNIDAGLTRSFHRMFLASVKV